MENDHKSSLFLMELILAIFFFALASAVCMRLFARSHTLRGDTEDLNQGVFLAQSAAAAFESAGGDLSQLVQIFPEGSLDAGGQVFTVYYQSSWEPLAVPAQAGEAAGTSESPAEAAYRLSVSLEEPASGSSLRQAQVTVSRLGGAQETIFSIPAAVQTPRKAAEAEGPQAA